MEEFVAAGYRRHYGRVYRFVRRRARSAEDAEDLTQEVFEAAAAAFADERLTSEPELAWLYTVAERRLVDTWRRQSRTEPFAPDGGTAVTAAERGAYGAEVTQALLAGLRRLPVEQRRVVLAKLVQGRPFAEIASALGLSEEACRMRLSRGLASLRDFLRAEGLGQ